METTEIISEPRRLTRPREGRWLGGVAAGLAAYFDLSPTIYRIAFVALALAGGTGVLLYIAAWLVIPGGGRGGLDRGVELKEAPRPAPARRRARDCSASPGSSCSPKRTSGRRPGISGSRSRSGSPLVWWQLGAAPRPRARRGASRCRIRRQPRSARRRRTARRLRRARAHPHRRRLARRGGFVLGGMDRARCGRRRSAPRPAARRGGSSGPFSCSPRSRGGLPFGCRSSRDRRPRRPAVALAAPTRSTRSGSASSRRPRRRVAAERADVREGDASASAT